MKRLIVSAVIATLYCAAVPAAPLDQHVRGTILSVTPETLTVRTSFWWAAAGARVGCPCSAANPHQARIQKRQELAGDRGDSDLRGRILGKSRLWLVFGRVMAGAANGVATWRQGAQGRDRTGREAGV